MQLYFTTVFRGAPLNQAGELVHLDWERKEVIRTVPVFPSNPDFVDPNPRGGGRGGRGVALLNGNVIAASYHTLHVYNRALQHQQDISHPNFVGIHEIRLGRPNHIWVASTMLDLALELNLTTGQTTREYWARELPGFQKKLDVSPMKVDKTADNRIRFLHPKHFQNRHHLHLNATASWRGQLYALFAVKGVIANLDTQEIIISDPEMKPGHSLHISAEGIATVLGSHSRTIRCYDLSNGKLVQRIDLLRFREIQDLLRWPNRINRLKNTIRSAGFRRLKISRPLFLRGLDIVGRKLFIGANPAIILCFDLETAELVDTFSYSTDVRLCIHGIKMAEE